MDGGDGSGDGDELVVGGDGTGPRPPPRRASGSAPVRSATTSASVAGGRARRARRSRADRARRSRARSTSAAAPADRPRSSRRPAAPTSSDPAISTGCVSGTGRPSRTARQAAYTRKAMPSCRPSATDAVGHEVAERLVAAAGRERRVDEPHGACPGRARAAPPPARRCRRRRGARWWRSRRRRRPRRRPRPRSRAATNAKSRLPRHDECAAAGVVALREAAVDLLDPVERVDRADPALDGARRRRRAPGTPRA